MEFAFLCILLKTENMKIIFTFLLLLSFVLTSNAQNFQEQLHYTIKFGPIKGGEATFTLSDTTLTNNQFLHSELHGYTTGFANKLYAVDDYFSSMIIPEQHIPVSSNKTIKEQNYRFQNSVKFDHEKEEAHSTNSGLHRIENGTLDISSLIHYIRYSNDFKYANSGRVIEVPFWDTDKFYMLKLKIAGMETVKTNQGTFECIKLAPDQVRGKFFSKNSPVNLWITNDENRLPLLMELNFTFGTVKCELIKHTVSENALANQ